VAVGGHIKFYRRAARTRPKLILNLLSLGFNIKFCVHNSDIDTAYRGFAERLVTVNGKVPPSVSVSHYRDVLSKTFNKIKYLIDPATPLDPHEFPRVYKDARRRNRYEEAVASLVTRPLEIRDSYSRNFSKMEKSRIEKNPVPRIISPRGPRYNVRWGCYTRPIEGKGYRMIDRLYGEKTVVKCYNASKVGRIIARKWGSFKDPAALSFDISRCDTHTQQAQIAWLHSVYALYYKHTSREVQDDFDWLAGMQFGMHGVVLGSDGSVSFRCPKMTRRHSGDMDTGLGTVIMVCTQIFAFLDQMKVRKCVVDNGDDAIIIVERTELERIQEAIVPWFKDIGFTVKVEEPVFVLEQIEFCRSRPVYTESGWKMVRNMEESLSKDSITWKNCIDVTASDKMRRAIGLCGLSLCGDVPIMRSYYQALMRDSGTKSASLPITGLTLAARGIDHSDGVITAASRVSFFRAFGVTPYHQIQIEEYFDNIVINKELQVSPFNFNTGLSEPFANTFYQ
jgi:hypothetical protein